MFRHRPRRVFAVGDQHRMVNPPDPWPRHIPQHIPAMFLPPTAAKTSRVFRPVCRFVPPPAAAEQTGNKRGCGVVRMVSRGKETPGYGANRLRRIGADEWVLVRGVLDSESYRNKRLLDWRRAEGIKPHYPKTVSTPTFFQPCKSAAAGDAHEGTGKLLANLNYFNYNRLFPQPLCHAGEPGFWNGAVGCSCRYVVIAWLAGNGFV